MTANPRTDGGGATTVSSVVLPEAVRSRSDSERWAIVVGLIALAGLVVWIAWNGGSALALIALLIGVVTIGLLHLHNVALERELRRARVRATDARDLERQRIQRDLHDGAQQRLVSVRIHLGLLAQREDPPADGAIIEELGRDLDIALSDLRSVTRDGSPEILLRNGVVDSLRSVAARTPMRVRVETDRFGRYAPRVERAVYFACLEALQNVLKHAGPKASARIRLHGEPGRITFVVEDSGVGFDPARVRSGSGLVNLADRIGAVGGRLTIDSRPGLGTLVMGDVPIASLGATSPLHRMSGSSRALRRSCHTGGGH